MKSDRFFSTSQRVAVAAAFALAGSALLGSQPARATQSQASKENQKCNYCHLANGKNPRNFRGIYYKSANFSFVNFDNVAEAKAAGVKPAALGNDAAPMVDGYPYVKTFPSFNFQLKSVKGEPINFYRYQGQVMLVVNTASAAPVAAAQISGLQALLTKYSSRGLDIVSFASNDFKSEPLNPDGQKARDAQLPWVSFPTTAVSGPGIAPHFKAWTAGKPVTSDFTKIIVGRYGNVAATFGGDVDPSNPAFVAALEKELAVK